MQRGRLSDALRAAAGRYPPGIGKRERARVESGRYSYEMSLLYSPGARIIDLGGGVACTALALSELGCDVSVVDDYRRPYYQRPQFVAAKELLGASGVQIIEADLVDTDLDCFAPNSVDVIASFGCVEHLHHSPKRRFEQAVSKLRPGGRFVIGVPNAVNLLKRARVLTGRTNLASLEEFYERGQPFTGHVREYTKAELLDVGRRLGLTKLRVDGRNFFGFKKTHRVPVALKRGVDQILRARPSLCSELYLVAQKG